MTEQFSSVDQRVLKYTIIERSHFRKVVSLWKLVVIWGQYRILNTVKKWIVEEHFKKAVSLSILIDLVVVDLIKISSVGIILAMQ